MAASAQIVVMLLKFCVIAAAAGCVWSRREGVQLLALCVCVCERSSEAEFIDF